LEFTGDWLEKLPKIETGKLQLDLKVLQTKCQKLLITKEQEVALLPANLATELQILDNEPTYIKVSTLGMLSPA